MKSLKRKELRQKRELVKNRDILSNLIADAFLATDLYGNARTLLLYSSVGSEVSTDKILRTALSDNKNVAFPVCINEDGAMEFYYVNDVDELDEGMYGIRAPKEGCKKFEDCGNALCIVPGLAFDKEGYRIGYGKGYYDRFLEGFSGLSVGFCFEEMLEDALPTDDFDKRADYLITDKNIYKFTD